MLTLLLATLLAAEPVEFSGRVVAVHDGDTLTMLVDGDQQIKIRFHGIDAPEKRQAFGKRSKEHLSELVFGREVRFVWRGQKHRERLIGTVWIDDVDVGEKMVADGFAWHDPQYSKDPKLAAAEIDAREAKRGLWIDSDPVEPKKWRKLPTSQR